MGEDTIVVGPRKRRWGTWEELILGGAVLRHGTQDWDVVAAELRARTLYPYSFTPKVCKAKYQDLQQRYSGCTGWFEELRKRRVAELKRELEKSENSIGSLESKLESLKAEKESYNQVDYGSSPRESPAPLPKTEGIESSGKATSKDGLSAGSFTQDTRTNWSHDFQIPALASAPEMEAKPEIMESYELEKPLCITKLAETSNEQGGTLRKRRGKRKRKDCSREAKEGSIEESDNLGSTGVVTVSNWKETSNSDCGQTLRSTCIDGTNGDSCRLGSDDLVGIFDSVAENENALVFRRRLDSQKRARYRNIIRQHMDFDTIRSRIAKCSIKSARELFRDLLLLANNALVFYSKRTLAFKSALSLRENVMKAYWQHCKGYGSRASPSILRLSPMCNPPGRPRSVRPHPSNRQLPAKLPNAENIIAETPQGYKKLSDADSSPLSLHSLVTARRSAGTTQGYKKLSNADSSTISLQPLVTAKKGAGTMQGCKKLSNADSSTISLQPLVKAKKSVGTPQGHRKLSNADSSLTLQSLVMVKKALGRPGKVGRRTGNQQPKTTTMKEKKGYRQR